MKRFILALSLTVAGASPVLAQHPAARVGDSTSHGGSIVGPGVPSVLIGGLPAAVIGDQTTCPLFNGTPPDQVPHVGGPIVSASATVFIGGKPAARVGDVNAETGSSATIVSGAPTVMIGP
jgi:uncharacterized Zn-binding protein involved in type VI secretion